MFRLESATIAQNVYSIFCVEPSLIVSNGVNDMVGGGEMETQMVAHGTK